MAKQKQEMLRSSDCDIKATKICQKSKSSRNLKIVVATNTVENHDIFLLALESIDCVNLES